MPRSSVSHSSSESERRVPRALSCCCTLAMASVTGPWLSLWDTGAMAVRATSVLLRGHSQRAIRGQTCALFIFPKNCLVDYLNTSKLKEKFANSYFYKIQESDLSGLRINANASGICKIQGFQLGSCNKILTLAQSLQHLLLRNKADGPSCLPACHTLTLKETPVTRLFFDFLTCT